MQLTVQIRCFWVLQQFILALVSVVVLLFATNVLETYQMNDDRAWHHERDMSMA